jgi:predicted ferric reductase
MISKTKAAHESNVDLPDGTAGQDILITILVFLAGVFMVVNLLPLWLPGLAFSVSGTEPKFYWFLSRGSAIAAYWILWLSMAMGIAITNKMAKIWPGISLTYEIHQFTSILGLGFALFHALILIGDRYIAYNIFQVLVPFASQNYRPTWVGLGQLGFYSWAVVTLSFYVRKQIHQKTWRSIHYLSYASFLGVMLHGIFSGTDSSALWIQILYWLSAAGLLFLTIYRIILPLLSDDKRQQRAAPGRAL